MDTIATMTSVSLQYGVPLKALVDKFSHTRFEPSGFTNNREIPIAKSLVDYVFRYLGNRYLESEIAEFEAGAEAAEGTGGGETVPLRGAIAGGKGGGNAGSPFQAEGPASSTRQMHRPAWTAARS
jgi:hypothetical protein